MYIYTNYINNINSYYAKNEPYKKITQKDISDVIYEDIYITPEIILHYSKENIHPAHNVDLICKYYNVAYHRKHGWILYKYIENIEICYIYGYGYGCYDEDDYSYFYKNKNINISKSKGVITCKCKYKIYTKYKNYKILSKNNLKYYYYIDKKLIYIKSIWRSYKTTKLIMKSKYYNILYI